MTQPPLVLGIDLGTSGVRIAVLGMDGVLHHTQASNYHGSFCDPESWREACRELLQAIPNRLQSRLRALAVDGTSGTLLACDSHGLPLGEALPYSLACPEVAPLLQELVGTGNLAQSSSSSLARALRLLARYGNEIQPDIRRSGSILGTIAPNQAKALGLADDLIIVAGTTDSNAAVLAAHPQPGDGVTVLGTTLVMKCFTETPLAAPGVTSHRVGERWLCGGASNAGAGVLRRFYSDDQLAELSRQIDPDTNSGLSLRPLPGPGERFPVDDPELLPVLEPRPVSDALYLHGLLEGLAEIEAQGWQRLQVLGAAAPQRIISIGGGARNPQWRRLRERRLGCPVTSCQTPPAAGVARLAQQALVG